MLTRRVRTTLDRALLGEALRGLEEQLRPLATALPAAGPCIATHGSDSPALGGTAAVVRDRRDVLDGLDLQPRGGQRLDGRLAAAAGPLHAHVDALHTGRQRLASALLCRDGRR